MPGRTRFPRRRTQYPALVTAAPTVSRPLAQLPNALTVARLIVIPVYAILILRSVNGHSWAAAILFALAAITDQIDGFLARRWHVESAFGKVADPLADRLLIVLTPVALHHGYQFEVNRLGKIATWFLYASLALVMVVHGTWPRWIFWTGFVLAVISLCQYFLKARQEIVGEQGRGNLSS